MKIFASDFTDRLNTGTIIEKCKIRSKGVVKGSRDLVLKFWDPLRISVMLEARNFKCGKHRPRGTLTKKCKIRSKGVGKRTFDLLLEFWDFLYVSRELLKLETSNLE